MHMFQSTKLRAPIAGLFVAVLAAGAVGKAAFASPVHDAVAAATTIAAPPTGSTTTTIPPGSKSINSIAIFDSTTLTSAAQKCEPNGICGRIGFAPVGFSGDIIGTATFVLSQFFDPLVALNNGSAGTIIASDLSINGCGRGTFVATFSGSYEKRAPNGLFPAHWEIARYARGGEFAGRLEGEGTLTAEPLSATASVVHMTGVVRC